MNRSTIRLLLLAAGVLLLLLSILPGVPAAYALPLAALTPTAEPPTRTPLGGTPAPTLPPRPTVQPTATPDTPPTSSTPKPETERADPAVTKSVSPSEARIGDIVDFTITVTNHGGETADDVVVTDDLPDFLDVVDANTSKGTITISGRTIVTMIGSVAPGEVVIIHIRARVNEQAQPPGGRNSVTLVSSNNSDDPINNTDSITLGILTSAAGPTATPPEVLGTPVGEAPNDTPAGGSNLPGQPAPAPPRLPTTGAGDDHPDTSWPLALLGLAVIGLSLALRRHGATKV